MYAFHIFFLCKKKVSLPSWLGGEAWAIPYEVIFGTAATALYLTLAGGKLSGSLARDEVLPTAVDAEEEKGKMAETFIFLGLAYYGSGYAGQGINTLLCLCAALGAPLTIGMCTSLQVLLSHLLWVAAGSWILLSHEQGQPVVQDEYVGKSAVDCDWRILFDFFHLKLGFVCQPHPLQTTTSQQAGRHAKKFAREPD
jgi:hypothetical protein